MGVTLTGKVIKDTYDGILKFEDNQALSSSLRRITDGLGNDTSMKLSSDSASFLNLFNERTVSQIGGDDSGNVVVTRDYLESITGNSYSAYIVGNGVKQDFDITHPFNVGNIMVQLWNNSNGQLLNVGAGSLLQITRSTNNVNIDFNTVIPSGNVYTVTILNTASVQV
jgi:hypothetical protein